MYASDLDLLTKARLNATHDTAQAQRRVPHHFPRWLRRAASQVVAKITPH
ncbi:MULTISPECIES: hypothetical protein [Deinococcus]|nr:MULTISPECIES: hypothetical protein [Deinococcus]